MLGDNLNQGVDYLTVDHLSIDHNLYSRQIGAYGVEAMGKLVALKVYIYGLRGVFYPFNFLLTYISLV